MMHTGMKKMLTAIWCIVLTAALALTFTGCSGSPAPTTAAPAGPEISYTVITVDLEGKETTFDITTTEVMVGQALVKEGIIEGEDSEYGMFIHVVNGVELDWERDGKYWAFYVDGEYAITGVDMTEAVDGAVYSLKPES